MRILWLHMFVFRDHGMASYSICHNFCMIWASGDCHRHTCGCCQSSSGVGSPEAVATEVVNLEELGRPLGPCRAPSPPPLVQIVDSPPYCSFLAPIVDGILGCSKSYLNFEIPTHKLDCGLSPEYWKDGWMLRQLTIPKACDLSSFD